MRPLSAALAKARRSTLAQNTAALYAVHAATLLLPLVTIPYLARVLRPEGWGPIVFAQSFAAWLALVLEYGFHLSATREIARVREDRGRIAAAVADVQGARLLLVLIIAALGAVAFLGVPLFRAHPTIFAWAWLLALAQGLSPFWYFQGMERMKLVAVLEVLARAAATGAVFVVVTVPSDGWKVLAVQAATTLAWVAITTWLIYREVPLLVPRLSGAVRMLRQAWGIFVFRSASGMYLQANGFILGLAAGPQAVAFFAGAEKVMRAAISMIQPASQALYPRVSHLAANDPNRARSLVRLSLVLVGALGAAIGLGTFLAAPLLIAILLGPGYEEAVPVMQILSLLPPVIAVGTVLGIQWALPMGLERPFYRLVVTAGLLNVVLAFALAPVLGAVGMAISVVVADVLVASGLVWLALRRGDGLLRPLRRTSPPGAVEEMRAAAVSFE